MNKPDITLLHLGSDFLIDPATFPPLGILYLSAHLKKCGYRVQCLDLGLGHSLDDCESEVVGISFCTPQRAAAWEAVAVLREQGKYLIAGGPHPTHLPSECYQKGFHHVIGGYGEERLTAWLRAHRRNTQDHYWGHVHPDRLALPLHDYHYQIAHQPATTMLTSRGCPARCSFCAQLQRGVQYYPVEHVVQEIHQIAEHGFRAIQIFDDFFAVNPTRLKAICEGVADLGLRYRCFARANLVTPTIATLLVRLGVVEVGIGIESGAGAVLDRNMKGSTPEDNLHAVRLLHDHGIRVKGFLIVGLPGETPTTLEATDAWLAEAHLDDVDFTVFQPMPGSPIYDDPEAYGLLDFNPEAIPHYKGRPGEYSAPYCYATLSAADLVDARDRLERTYKKWTS